MAPAMAERRGRKQEKSDEGKKGERRKRGRNRNGRGEETPGISLRTTVALFITPGITEFTIKIPRSAGIDGSPRATPRRLWYFQMNPPPFSSRRFLRGTRRRSHIGTGVEASPACPPPLPFPSLSARSLLPPFLDDINEFRGANLLPRGCFGNSISVCRCSLARSLARSLVRSFVRSID